MVEIEPRYAAPFQSFTTYLCATETAVRTHGLGIVKLGVRVMNGKVII